MMTVVFYMLGHCLIALLAAPALFCPDWKPLLSSSVAEGGRKAEMRRELFLPFTMPTYPGSETLSPGGTSTARPVYVLV